MKEIEHKHESQKLYKKTMYILLCTSYFFWGNY